MSVALLAWREFQRTLWERHNGLCGICREPVALAVMQIDHIVSQANGGPHEVSNLQPSHKACNLRKGPGPSRYRSTRQPAIPQEPMMTVAEVAERLRVGPETVRRWLRAKKLPGRSYGRGRTGWRIARVDVDQFVTAERGEKG